MVKTSFAKAMKWHQLSWALANGVTPDMLETRKGQISWVLKEEYREQNLFKPRWWVQSVEPYLRWTAGNNPERLQ